MAKVDGNHGEGLIGALRGSGRTEGSENCDEDGLGVHFDGVEFVKALYWRRYC
jgi:hypothetical protein